MSIPSGPLAEPEGFAVQSETSVVAALDPLDLGSDIPVIVVAYNDATEVREQGEIGQGVSIAGWAYSEDLGATWVQQRLPVPKGFDVLRADPWLTTNRGIWPWPSTLYYSFLAWLPGENPRVLVFPSEDGGRTFGLPEVAGVPNEVCGGVDKPTTAVDLLGGLHVVYFGSLVRTPICTTSRTLFGPEGEWSEPMALTGPNGIASCSENCDDGCDDNPIVRTAMPGRWGGAVYMTSEGAVVDGKEVTKNLCAWRANALVWPPTWELVTIIGNVNPRWSHPGANGIAMRTLGTTDFDVALDGTLVLAFTDRVTVGSVVRDHVFVTYSDPYWGGEVWAAPREISPGGDWEEFQPAVSAHDEDGLWAVTFYSTERDPANNVAVDVMGVTVDRDGIYPPRRRLTKDTEDGPTPFEPCQTAAHYFGDYQGTAALPGVFRYYSAWADARLGCIEQGALWESYHQHVYGVRWR